MRGNLATEKQGSYVTDNGEPDLSQLTQPHPSLTGLQKENIIVTQKL